MKIMKEPHKFALDHFPTNLEDAHGKTIRALLLVILHIILSTSSSLKGLSSHPNHC